MKNFGVALHATNYIKTTRREISENAVATVASLLREGDRALRGGRSKQQTCGFVRCGKFHADSLSLAYARQLPQRGSLSAVPRDSHPTCHCEERKRRGNLRRKILALSASE